MMTYLRRVEVDGEVAGKELEDVLGVLGEFEVRHHQWPDAKDQMKIAGVSLPFHSLEINNSYSQCIDLNSPVGP